MPGLVPGIHVFGLSRHCERAKQSIVPRKQRMDCRVAALLAMTAEEVVIPGRVENANLRGAIAPWGISRFPDAQLRI